jgi:hypothetical protein
MNINSLFSRNLIVLFFLLPSISLFAQPPCNEEIAEPTAGCPEAPIVCELDFFCSTMPGINNSGGPVCNGGFYLHNTHWFSFIATSTTVTVTIAPTNCIPVGGGLGLQGAIVEYCPESFPYPTVGYCQGACTSSDFTIGSGGSFVVGQQYWIMLDGCSGSICDYQVVATQGVSAPVLENPSTIWGSTQTCPGGTVIFTVDGLDLATTLHWTIDSLPVTSSGPELVFTFPSGMEEGIYQVCLDNAENPCFNLVDDNDYVPGSLCFEIEVLNLPETNAGQIDVCIENAPYERDGQNFYPPATNYRYILQTSDGCDSIINFSINWIQLELSFEITPLSGPTKNDGAIESTVSGGTPPYIYLWSNGETTSSISGLPPDLYSVTATDSNGCFKLDSANIQPFECNLEVRVLAAEDATCFGREDGSVEVEALQNEGVVTYVWSNGFQGSILQSVGVGNYIVTATDELECTATLNVEIQEPSEIVIDLQLTLLSDVGESDGAINAVIAGGTGNITYAWSTGEETPRIEMLPEGIYSITVTDENGCTAVAQANIRFECLLDGNINIMQAISCFGDNNGILEIVPVNGRAPYQYLWEDGNLENSRSDLSAGVYRVTITDGTNCTIDKSISLDQPEILSAEVLVFTPTIEQEGEGIIEVIGQGGTPPYQYSWQKDGVDAGNQPLLENLDEGDYMLRMTDANDCAYEKAFRIDVVTSVKDGDLNGFKWRIYPNPVSNLLHIEVDGLDESVQLSVLDAMGREVLSESVSAGQTHKTISVEFLPNGVYNIMIKDSSSVALKRIILVH